MRVTQNMFGELNDAAQPKILLAKYSIEFNDLAVQTRPRFLFEAVGRLVEQLIHLYITTMECKVITVMSL